jgi:hypothetical protein
MKIRMLSQKSANILNNKKLPAHKAVASKRLPNEVKVAR